MRSPRLRLALLRASSGSQLGPVLLDLFWRNADAPRIIHDPGGAVTDGCVFCRVVARESPADIVYEDEEVLAFKDLYPKAPIHYLIVPKRHIESLATVESADAELLGRCLQAARVLGERTGYAGRGYR